MAQFTLEMNQARYEITLLVFNDSIYNMAEVITLNSHH